MYLLRTEENSKINAEISTILQLYQNVILKERNDDHLYFTHFIEICLQNNTNLNLLKYNFWFDFKYFSLI